MMWFMYDWSTARVLTEGAEGQLPGGLAASLHFSLHWQVVETVLNVEFP